MITPKAVSVTVDSVNGTAKNIAINGRAFMISNTGAQPLYINPAAVATAENGFLIPPNTTLNFKMTCSGNLSVVSNATGTTLAVLFFDL